MDASISDRFREGLAWLDQDHPGWRARMSTQTLDMGDSNRCVAAQLTGTGGSGTITPYLDALAQLGLTTDQAYALGLDTVPSVDYPLLTAMWSDAITYPVMVLGPTDPATDRVTCGTCGRSWDDAVSTAYTPAPGARCPFEYWHIGGEED